MVMATTIKGPMAVTKMRELKSPTHAGGSVQTRSEPTIYGADEKPKGEFESRWRTEVKDVERDEL